jgi:ribosomal protein S18 acetylase RimI-like enzyme
MNGKIVGYILALQDWGRVNIALWLAVEEELRGKGIGRKLLEFWEKNSKKNDNHALLLYTTTQENRKFYKHMGFTEGGFLPNFWFNIDHYVFYKHI